MADIVDSKTRSRMMSGIRGKDTRPEMLLRRALHAAGLRYRLHRKDLPGKPDLVFPRQRCVIFIHGCFWHQHSGCRFATVPKTRREFWAEKFRKNRDRDRQAVEALLSTGWRVAVVWECALKSTKLSKLETEVADWLYKGRDFVEF